MFSSFPSAFITKQRIVNSKTTVKTTKVKGNSQKHTPGSWTVHEGFNLMDLKILAILTFAHIYIYINIHIYIYIYVLYYTHIYIVLDIIYIYIYRIL